MNAGHLLWNLRRAWAGANLCKDRPLAVGRARRWASA